MDAVEALSRDLHYLGVTDKGVSKKLVEMGWTKSPKPATPLIHIQSNVMKGALPLYQPSVDPSPTPHVVFL